MTDFGIEDLRRFTTAYEDMIRTVADKRKQIFEAFGGMSPLNESDKGKKKECKNEFGEKEIDADEKDVKRFEDILKNFHTMSFFKSLCGNETELSKLTNGGMSAVLSDDGEGISHYIATVYGGENGWGSWTNYLRVIQRLADALKREYNHVWLIDLKNDCVDDSWTMRIAFRDNRDGDLEWDDDRKCWLKLTDGEWIPED